MSRIPSYLVKSRHGIYYLRIQKNGCDKRVSLRTKDPKLAKLVAYEMGAKLMTIDIDKLLSGMSDYRGFEIKTKDIHIKTDGSKEDNLATITALKLLSQQDKLPASFEDALTIHSIPLKDSIDEFLSELVANGIKPKTLSMTKNPLYTLINILGGDFKTNQLNDDVIYVHWEMHCKKVKKNHQNTIVRNFSYLKEFSEWAAHPSKRYISKAFTNKFEKAESEHYEYFEKSDLEKIYTALHKSNDVDSPWKFWVPLIGLYTGGRISEICSLEPSHFFVKSDLNIMHLPGTKTDASKRDIPMHPDLVDLGLLEYVNKNVNNDYIFDVTDSEQNGRGAAASKWFGSFLIKLGVNDTTKRFSSFRHTITDHLNQVGCIERANFEYTGHTKDDSVKNKNYGRKLLSLKVLKFETTDKMNWSQYIDWEPNIKELKKKADTFLKAYS